jgi:hypothetical protein
METEWILFIAIAQKQEESTSVPLLKPLFSSLGQLYQTTQQLSDKNLFPYNATPLLRRLEKVINLFVGLNE